MSRCNNEYMRDPEYENVIQAITPQRPDQPFRVWVLLW